MYCDLWINMLLRQHTLKEKGMHLHSFDIRTTYFVFLQISECDCSFKKKQCRFLFKNLYIIVLLSRVQRFNNLQNIFHVKKLLQSYISPYNSIKQNKNFISIHFHKMLYTARKIFLFCFQKYRSFLLDHLALGATAHGN